MTIEEIKQAGYYDMIVDAWKFLRNTLQEDTSDKDKFWQRTIDSQHEINKKYHDCKFISDLMTAVMGEIVRKTNGQI